MDELIPLQQGGELVYNDKKKYYGYVLTLSRKQLDTQRRLRGIRHDDFLEVNIRLVDEDRLITMSYEEFVDCLPKQRIDLSVPKTP